MQSLEFRIGNYRQLLYNANNPNVIYYSFSDGYIKDDDVDLPYGYELIDVKVEEISDAYLDAIGDYIEGEIVIPGRDALPVLVKFKKRKRDAYGNPIGENNSNPILDTRIYELGVWYRCIEEFTLNVLAENLFNKDDSYGWDTGLID